MRPAKRLRIAIFIFLTANSITPNMRLHAQNRGAAQVAEGIDWSNTSPIGFLNILKSGRRGGVHIEEAPKNWILDGHLNRLMQLIDSNDPAAPVVSKRSSYYPFTSSTVGNEAMYLIEGFIMKKYPPTISSVYDFKPNPISYRRWWHEYVMSGRSNTKIGAAITRSNRPRRAKILEDSKKTDLSLLDIVVLKKEPILLGSSKIDVLVNRFSDKVEYVWSIPHKRYIRPKFVLPTAQTLYNRRRR